MLMKHKVQGDLFSSRAFIQLHSRVNLGDEHQDEPGPFGSVTTVLPGAARAHRYR